MLIKDSIRATILELLRQRGPGKSICPSEVARACAAQGTQPAPRALWQPLMEPVRRVARDLVASGEIVVTQRGVPVDPSAVKGPIRYKLP